MTDAIIEKLRNELLCEIEICLDYLASIDIDEEDAINRLRYFQHRHNTIDEVLKIIRRLEKYGD